MSKPLPQPMHDVDLRPQPHLCGSCATKHGFITGAFCAGVLPADEHISDLAARMGVSEREVRKAAIAFVAAIG